MRPITCVFRSFILSGLAAGLAVAIPASAIAQSPRPHVHPTPPATNPGRAGAPSGGTVEDRAMGMADRAMSGLQDSIARLHLLMTPSRKATAADSARAWRVIRELRTAIARYADTTAAVADGFKLFAPNLKTQHTYHFTRNVNALGEAFRFDPAKPTSLLYEKSPAGQLKLVGAMYTMPKIARVDRLDERIPTSIAAWHRHVNWCMPKRDQPARWLEQRGGRPVFGPESPIATKADCEKAGGDFQESLFGWMVHANVFAGDDLGTIFGDHHR